MRAWSAPLAWRRLVGDLLGETCLKVYSISGNKLDS